MYFHVNLNFSKFNKVCICWRVNNIPEDGLHASSRVSGKSFHL